MTGEAAAFLVSEAGAEVLQALTEEARDTLEAGRFLRRAFPDIPASNLSAAVEVAVARTQAAGKFDHADRLFYTHEALEQATDARIAVHRARRFAGLGRVYDLCCGVGGDAIALGGVVHDLICVDRDPVRVLFCRENLRIMGVPGEVHELDVVEMIDDVAEADAMFIDPARRSQGTRMKRPEDMLPSLDTVEALLRAAPRGAAKLSPAIDPSLIIVPHETEWISTESGLKEAVVWTGEFRKAKTTVTLIHRGVSRTDTELPGTEPEVGTPAAYLYEPDPALIRSGLLGRMAQMCGMQRIDEKIAYMSADTLIDDPFFTGYHIIESFPFTMKRLRERLQSLNAGALTVKKRGFPLLPEEVIRKLKLTGDHPATVVLTRIGEGHHAFIVERC